MRVSVYREASFNSAHRLHNPSWTKEQNERVFGLCNNPNYHGHNYKIVVKVTGEVDPETGYVIDLKIVNDLIKELITERFDHRNLNLDVEEFKSLNPTVENIAIVSYNLLRARLHQDFDLQVRLYETPRNYVDYPT